MNKAYDKVTWVNKPSTASPINQTNLNKMSDALDIIDDRVIALDSGKVSSVTVTNTLPTGDTIATITVDGTSTNIKSAQITVDSEISTTSTNPVQNKVIAEALREVMPEVTVEGNPISITDGSNIVPAKLAEVTFLPKQSGSGEPSPDNVRPISGWTELNLTRTGKNIYPYNIDDIKTYTGGTWTGNSITFNGITFTLNDDGTIKATGKATANTNLYIFSKSNVIEYAPQFLGCKLNGCPSGGSNSTYRVRCVLFKGATSSSQYIDNIDDVGNGVDIPNNPDYPYVRINIQILNNYQCPTDGLLFKPMIRLATFEDGTFEPYQGETYTESLGSTYYGGKVTWNADGSCTATIDTHYITENNFVLGSSGTSSGGLHYFNTSNTPMVLDKVEGKCNMLEYKGSGWSSTTPCYCTKEGSSPNFTAVRIYDDSATLSDFKTKYAGLQITYPVDTPTELTLTPQEIELLKGQNVLWSDSNGNIKLTYSADIAQYIANQLNS